MNILTYPGNQKSLLKAQALAINAQKLQDFPLHTLRQGKCLIPSVNLLPHSPGNSLIPRRQDLEYNAYV